MPSNPPIPPKFLTSEEDRQNLIRLIATFLIDGQNIRGITIHLKVNERTLYKYNVVIPARDLANDRIQDKVIRYYFSGKNIGKVAQLCKMGTTTVKKILCQNNIVILSSAKARKVVNHLNNPFNCNLSKITLEIIEGGLLGDLNLRCKNKNTFVKPKDYLKAISFIKNLRKEALLANQIKSYINYYNQAIIVINKINTGYLRYHKSLLEWPWLTVLEFKFKKDLKTNLGLSISSKGKITCRMESQANVLLSQIYFKWYVCNKKQLPPIFKLTPNSMLLWLIGDGSTSHHRIELNSQNFSKNDNKILSKKLKELSIETKVRKKNYSNSSKDYFYLDIMGRNNSNQFFDYIDKADDFLLLNAKNIFPWKFSHKILKKEVIEDLINNYNEVERKFLVIPTNVSYLDGFKAIDGMSYRKI